MSKECSKRSPQLGLSFAQLSPSLFMVFFYGLCIFFFTVFVFWGFFFTVCVCWLYLLIVLTKFILTVYSNHTYWMYIVIIPTKCTFWLYWLYSLTLVPYCAYGLNYWLLSFFLSKSIFILISQNESSVRPVFQFWDWEALVSQDETEKPQSQKTRLRPRLKRFGLRLRDRYRD